MKILFLSAADNAHTIKIVNELAKNNMKVNLVSLKDHKHTEKCDKLDDRINIIYLPFKGKKGYYLNILNLKKIVKKYSPDIVNVHYASGYGTLGRYLKFENKILNVWGSDIFLYPKKNFLTKKIIMKNLEAYKTLATTSSCMREEIKKYTSKEIFLTPFGIDTLKFQIKNKENNMKNKIVIGITKNLKEVYGINYLIEGIYKLIKNDKEKRKIELCIYGEGEERKTLEELVKTLGISTNIKFKGYLPNNKIAQELEEVDIMCFPSLSESFGVSALESMSCGIPTIASDAVGFLEIIKSYEDGIIIPKQSSEKIYEALTELINDRKLYNYLSMNSRKKIIEKYSLEETTKKFIEVYLWTLRN